MAFLAACEKNRNKKSSRQESLKTRILDHIKKYKTKHIHLKTQIYFCGRNIIDLFKMEKGFGFFVNNKI